MNKTQKRRVSLRNTLIVKKYGFPFFFMMNVLSAMLIILIIKFWY
jgi:hypothetical protein